MERQILLDSKQLYISCVVPIFNEQDGVENFVTQLATYIKTLTNRYEIILIDDGSRDNTVGVIESKLLNDSHVKLIQFSRNFGKEIALTAGLQHVEGDVALLIDSDFQHPFEVIPTFLTHWAQGYDMAYGVREDRRDESFMKRYFTNIFYKLMDMMSEISIPADAGDFRLLDRKVVEALNQCGEHSRFMKGLYAWVGFKSIAVPYPVRERQTGQSSFRFRKLAGLALTGLISFSDVPLRIWGLIGLAISSVSFIYALCIVFATLFFGKDVPGYATIIVCVLFFGGIQLLSIGMLGEYIARIFREVKQRPTYIIAKTHGIQIEKK